MLKTEISHSKSISHRAEKIWNWTTAAGKIRVERRAQLLVKAAKMVPADIVLELGCGTGIFTEKIFNLTGSHITALDISPEMIRIAKEKNILADFTVADATQSGFPDNNFDVVFGSSVLHHLEIREAIKELYRVLKPGGTIYFTEPNLLNPCVFFLMKVPFIRKLSKISPDETAFLRWKLFKQLKETGFKDIELVPIDFLHPLTPPALISLVQKIGLIAENTPLLKEFAGSIFIKAKK